MKKLLKNLIVPLVLTLVAFVAYSNRDQLPDIAKRTASTAVELSNKATEGLQDVTYDQAPSIQEESNYETTDKRLPSGYKPIVLTQSYEHDKWNTLPKESVREFRAYVTSFDDNSDGVLSRNPDWVAYEIRKKPEGMPSGKAPKRPSKWIEDDKYEDDAPHDNSYKNSGFSRGHMCMKHIAWRLGANADYNTHTTINASPQTQKFNAGIWLDMEYLTQDWADKYGRVWVICGGAYRNNKPTRWIGDAGEERVAIPEFFWKVVIRMDGEELKSMAFMYPHEAIDKNAQTKKYSHTDYLTSINEVERMTGLDFLTDIEDEKEEALENLIAVDVWTK